MAFLTPGTPLSPPLYCSPSCNTQNKCVCTVWKKKIWNILLFSFSLWSFYLAKITAQLLSLYTVHTIIFLSDDFVVKKIWPEQEPTFIFVSWTGFNRSEWGNIVNIYFLRTRCDSSWEQFSCRCVWMTTESLLNLKWWVCRALPCCLYVSNEGVYLLLESGMRVFPQNRSVWCFC